MTEQLPDFLGYAPALIPLLLAGGQQTHEYLPPATEPLLNPDKDALAAISVQ